MFLLPLDVALHRIPLRLADRERAVSGLPGEVPGLRLLVDPPGGVGLDPAGHFGNGGVRLEPSEEVNVIRHTAGGEQRSTLVPYDTAKVGVEPVLETFGEQGGAILGAEDEVKEQIGKGARHGLSCWCDGPPPLRGGGTLSFGDLGLSPQATNLG